MPHQHPAINCEACITGTWLEVAVNAQQSASIWRIGIFARANLKMISVGCYVDRRGAVASSSAPVECGAALQQQLRRLQVACREPESGRK